MPEIRELSASMINKIAAGEVIERPASVVKELVENSLDSGATRIEINVEKSGFDLIRIVDNGCGIKRDQLRLALSPHATSKIADADDLFKIKTLGFRGEALASIAEVCQLVVQSRTPDSEEGAEIRSEGGIMSEPIPCGIAPGSIISVRNIFFNIPARRKFLKSPTTEFGHISEMVNRLVLPNPEIAFVFRHNGRVVYELHPSSPQDRITKVFGKETGEKLIYVESHRGEVHVFGYVGHPDCSRSNYNLQYYFLNKRFIRDRSLQHALTEAYRGLLPIGRFPIAFLQIEVPPDFVDVNVHPTKMEVRFLNPTTIYSGFLGAIREEFLRSDLRSRPDLQQNSTPRSEPAGEPTPAPKPFFENELTDPQKAMDEVAAENMRSQILQWAKGDLNATTDKTNELFRPSNVSESTGFPGNFDAAGSANVCGHRDQSNSLPGRLDSASGKVTDFIPFPDNGSATCLPGRYGNSSFGEGVSGQKGFGPSGSGCDSNRSAEGLTLHRIDPPISSKERTNRSANSKEPFIPKASNGAGLPDEVSKRPFITASGNSAISGTCINGVPVIQIHQRYLVMQTDDGMAIIDQHALHERILYEKICAVRKKGKLESQQLLVPIAVDLSPVESACVFENEKILAEFGLQVGEFGGNTIIITAYPTILEDVPPKDVLLTLLRPLLENGKKPVLEDLLDSMMHQMACKAAVKAGDSLRPDTIAALIKLATEEINSHHCPHGRPSTIIFSCQELDKLFKRT